VTVEERLRATTEAVTETMRPVRPLDLQPDAAAARARAERRLPRQPRRWPGWLIPLAAAMAVIAVAATLVTVRGLTARGPGPGSAPASPPAATSSASVPRYYVEIGPIGRDGRPTQTAVLADTRTGKQLATFSPPPDHFFSYTAAAADDNTFVLLASPSFGVPRSKAAQLASVWYVLRLPSGAPQRARLTRVPVAALSADTAALGLAVSPDGRTLAVLLQVISHVGSKKTLVYHLAVRTYSLATGQALRTWSDPAGPLSPTGPGTFNVSWLDDGRTIAFAAATRTVPEGIRFLDTTKPGTSLTADSRPVFSASASRACSTMLLTPDGKAVICGTYAPDNAACAAGQLEVTAYSVATGKLERVLYQYRGGCQPGGSAQVIWAPSGTLAIGATFVGSAQHNVVGLMAPGKFTALPFPSNGADYDAGTIAF
jgi:hypothetical protein